MAKDVMAIVGKTTYEQIAEGEIDSIELPLNAYWRKRLLTSENEMKADALRILKCTSDESMLLAAKGAEVGDGKITVLLGEKL